MSGKGTTQLIGFTGIAAGGFLIDCAIKNRSPWNTIKAIVSRPGDTQSILGFKGTHYDTTAEQLGPPGDTGGIGHPGDGNAPVVVQRVMAFWTAQLGKPYCHGGTGPNCFDCSGLMWRAYMNEDISIPRTTAGLVATTRLRHITSLAACKPGDIILPYPGHCFGYIGNNMMIEAPHTGTTVHKASVYKFWTARRVVNW